MNCSTFNKYLKDYMEDKVFMEVKNSMDDHLKTCNNCKKIYDKEMEIDKIFHTVLTGENITFTSSRVSIINQIDKNRYSKNPLVKLKYSIIKNRLKLVSTLAAALFVFVIVNGDILSKLNAKPIITVANNDMNKDKVNEAKSQAKIEAKSQAKIEASSEKLSKEEIKADTIMDYKPLVNELGAMNKEYENTYVPEFEIVSRPQSKKYDYPSSWKASPSKKFSVLLDGKGEMLDAEGKTGIIQGVLEEGTATIVVKDNKLNQYRDINIVNKNTQNSPLYLEWADEDNLLVVVGANNGSVVRGGNLYLLNINTGNATLIYQAANAKEQVATVKKLDKSLEMNLAVYEDDNFEKLHVEKKNITFDSVTFEDMAKSSVPTGMGVIDLSSAINDKDYNKAKALFLEDYDAYYKSTLGELKDIHTMKINKLIKIDNFAQAQLEKYKISDVITYCAEIDYNFHAGYKGPIKQGINYQKIIVVKTDDGNRWRIADIFTSPQS